MRSSKPGKSISASVENITPHGFWMHILGREYFLDYKAFPYFKGRPQQAVKKVILLHQHHLHWPSLDVDLEIDNLVNPQKYPLRWMELKPWKNIAVKAAEKFNKYQTSLKPNSIRSGRTESLAIAVKRTKRIRFIQRKRMATKGQSCVKK